MNTPSKLRKFNSLEPNTEYRLASLDAPREFRAKRERIVTIIVGIICENAIVLASDSQTTNDTLKRCNTKKLHPIKFKDGVCLVGESGNAALGDYFIQTFAGLAATTSIESADTIPDVAQAAMRKTRDHFRNQLGFTTEALQDYIHNRPDFYCRIMLASFHNATPRLHLLDILVPLAQKTRGYFEAVGCGADLGYYLLTEHAEPKMDEEFTTAIAVHTVETVKQFNPFCGGSTQVALLRCLPVVSLSKPKREFKHKVTDHTFRENNVRFLCDIVDAVNRSSRKHWRETVSKELRERTTEYLNLILSKMHK